MGATKRNTAAILDVMRKHKENEYCYHDVSKILNTDLGSASSIISFLKSYGMIRKVGMKRCEESGRAHGFYKYKKGTGSLILGTTHLSITQRGKAQRKNIADSVVNEVIEGKYNEAMKKIAQLEEDNRALTRLLKREWRE